MFGETLKTLRKEKRLSLRGLADALRTQYPTSINHSMLNRWEKGETLPRMEEAKILADFFNIKMDDLITFTPKEEPEIMTIYKQLKPQHQQEVCEFAESKLKYQNKVVQFPETQEVSQRDVPQREAPHFEYSVEVLARPSAGNGNMVFSEDATTYTVNTSTPPPTDYDKAWQVKGDSMEPLFTDGEVIYTKDTEEIGHGQVIVIMIDGELLVKKAYPEQNQLRLVSLNKQYEDIIVKEHNKVDIIGRVVF